jgi:alkanesulfonate monooxygenase SsuD/methylene tetrahydromethanopterin reductase-like flavin-dependent oxidoreductase (luciferase family)
MPIWISPERYAASWKEVRRHAADAGRDPEAIVPAAVVPALVGERGEDMRAELLAYLERRYGAEFSPQAIERYCLAGRPAECAARVEAYAEAGVRHLVVNPSVPPERLAEQVERLAGAVLTAAV